MQYTSSPLSQPGNQLEPWRQLRVDLRPGREWYVVRRWCVVGACRRSVTRGVARRGVTWRAATTTTGSSDVRIELWRGLLAMDARPIHAVVIDRVTRKRVDVPPVAGQRPLHVTLDQDARTTNAEVLRCFGAWGRARPGDVHISDAGRCEFWKWRDMYAEAWVLVGADARPRRARACRCVG
jgi:hypothetical protein